MPSANEQHNLCTCIKELAVADSVPGPVLKIRKYPNRRYYDQTNSRHLTLEQIHALVREGHEVQVTDSKSGRDITAKVLAQIIIELDAPKLDALPVPLLHQLLRTNQRLVTDFVKQYLAGPFDAFLASQRAVEQQLRSAIGLPQEAPTLTDWARVFFRQPAPPSAGQERSSPPGAAETGDLRRELDDMKQQLEQLRRGAGSPPPGAEPPPGERRSNRRRRGKT
jgi:polyhydroxyalkanoate synthesis repressor PhaR